MRGKYAGKSAERPVMDEDTIEKNTRGIEQTLRKLLKPPEEQAAEALIVNNLDWFGNMPLLVFLRDIGRYLRRSVIACPSF